MADPVRYTTEVGKNYRGGSYNDGGSHMVGWDSGSVRAEQYKFTTGTWPVTHIRWWGPTTSVYQGSNIAIRVGISTNESDFRNSYGTPSGSYAVNKNAYNELDINLAANTTYYFTFFPAVSRGSGWGLLNIGDGGSDNWFSVWCTEASYTQCTAPTTVRLSQSIQVPGGNVTLSWSGAVAGTNLSIVGYDIYRSTSSNGTFTKINGNNVVTGTSYTVAASSTRGDSYYYKVVARTNYFSTSEYDSPMSNASSGLKANSLPNVPTVTVNKNKVPSYGGSVIFTVTPGTDTDGQTRTLAYAITSGGAKTAFTSPLTTDNITSEKTYYFYTYDGLEYSNATTVTIEVNTKPVINTATYNSRTMYNAWGGNGITGSQLGYASNITPKISTNKTGTIIVDLEYYTSNETTAWDSSSPSRVTMQQSSISATTDVVLNNYNIHQYITLGSTNIHWRLRFKLNDGIEDSDYIYYPSTSDATYYSIARPSSLEGAFNQFSNSNITGTNDGEIWRRIRLKVYDDTSVPNTDVTATANNLALSNISVVTSTDNGYRYIDVTLPDGIAGGATINITAQMKDASNSITKSVSASVTETKIPTLSNLSHGAVTIKPFTDTGAFGISIGWPFGTYTELNNITLKAYNCSTTVASAIRFVHSSSNSGDGANKVIKTLTWTKDNDSIATSMNKQDAYEWDYSLGISSYNGSRTYYCRVEIVNLFGKIIATPWLSRTFNFKEKAQNVVISAIQWSEDTNSWTTLGADDKIQEGIYLKFDCSFGLYTTDEVIVSILLDNNNSGNFNSVECYEYGAPTRITPVTYLSTELIRATDTSIKTNTKSYVYHVTTEIADSINRKWKLQVKNTGGTTNGTAKTTKVERQCTPTLTFNSCTISDNNFTYAFTLTDNGFDNGSGSLTNYLWDGATEATSSLVGSSGTAQSILPSGWEVKTISVKSVSVVTGLITKTKTFYSNSIIVYQLAPTVAYRKNQLGINTKTPDSNATVDIHQASGKSTVLIQGVTTDGNLTPTKFELNVSTGEIKFYLYDTQNETYELKNTIDLLNGILS